MRYRFRNRWDPDGPSAYVAESAQSPTVVERCSPRDSMHRLQWFQLELERCSDISFHEFTVSSGQRCALIFCQGIVDQNKLQEELLNGILALDGTDPRAMIESIFVTRSLPVSEVEELVNLEEALDGILTGHVLLLLEGERRMLKIPLGSVPKRAIEDAPNESVIRGPRESFIESAGVNLALLRKRLRTKRFKSEVMEIGWETKTNVVIAYLDGICKSDLVSEVKRRLEHVHIDGVLDSSYVEEAIEDSPYSPFPQLQYTERPDTVSASLLEGRIAIIVDGSPIVLMAPTTLFSFLQSAEDYYQRYIASTWIRWIRYFFAVTSMLLPSFYIAVTTFHPEIIPSSLLITIAASREIVPFPALLEAFIMELAFEALREASIRIPKSIGQAVSIIGALIIGTAAVQAGIVSAAMVIIVSLTGIASFIIPHYSIGLSLRLLRFPIMCLAGLFGLYGIVFGLFIIYIHLINLRSFGVPYLTGITPLFSSFIEDTLLRFPWWSMRTRSFAGPRSRVRQIVKSRRWSNEGNPK